MLDWSPGQRACRCIGVPHEARRRVGGRQHTGGMPWLVITRVGPMPRDVCGATLAAGASYLKVHHTPEVPESIGHSMRQALPGAQRGLREGVKSAL